MPNTHLEMSRACSNIDLSSNSLHSRYIELLSLHPLLILFMASCIHFFVLELGSDCFLVLINDN